MSSVAADSARSNVTESMPLEGWGPLRTWAFTFSTSRKVENAMAFVITLNVVLMWWEVDIRGACKWRDTPDEECSPPFWITMCNVVLLLIYALELSIRFFAVRCRFFYKVVNGVETVIVLLGFVDLAMSLVPDANFPNLNFLRLFRLFKLLRTMRLLSHFPELWELMHGLISAVFAMFWGAVLIAIMLAIWSMLAVEFAPSKSEMPNDFREHDIPPWCYDAFSSVGHAMLYFFQTLIAGDSWGTCAIPIMRNNGVTVLVFLGALISVELGVMNLILAVIVESAASEREKDTTLQQKKRLEKERAGLEKWKSMVEELDTDNSGTLCLEELMNGFDTNPETQKVFNSFDMDRKNVEELFQLLDRDESGDLNYEEFFKNLEQVQSQDNRMLLLNIKLEISKIARTVNAAFAGTDSVPSERTLVTRPSKTLRPSKPGGKDDKAEDVLPASEPGGVSPRTPRASIVEVTDPELRKLQVQLDQLAQDAGAQADMLTRNTTMLEALLASSNVEDLSKTAQLSSSRSRRK